MLGTQVHQTGEVVTSEYIFQEMLKNRKHFEREGSMQEKELYVDELFQTL
ncbi:hypothetical protein AK88_04571 [Plasmodium fragile]|uniref:Uncharacterized protein n=1 Tax=Plasmodium fragile TaxID=5857 RepID=A0A0D9QG78_PLAFR|nr:uncharacterized protein AK88_04571 [Plasmodium fragile]KJP85812.1 hypothetical protein AK88_04571 [Plasmodium fragile]